MHSRVGTFARRAIFAGVFSLVASVSSAYYAQLSISPSEPKMWDTVTATLYMYNNTGIPLVDISTNIYTSGELTLLSGGSRYVANWAAGDSLTYTWTYFANDKGYAYLSVNSWGWDSGYSWWYQGDYASKYLEIKSIFDGKVPKGTLLIAPNVWDTTKSNGAINLVVKGKANDKVELRIFTSIGQFVGMVKLDLDYSGYGEYQYKGVRGGHLTKGIYWVLATGQGLNDKKAFKVIEGYK